MTLLGWMVFPSTYTVVSDTLLACEERSSWVLAAFMSGPYSLCTPQRGPPSWRAS
jgi:hypothetical protein